MNRSMLVVTLAGLPFAGFSALGFAHTPEETEQLRHDVEAIKQGQDALRKDLEEIKKLLQARQPSLAPSVVQTLDAVVEIGDAPLKGERDAKLTLMEFSDYQCPFCKRHADNTLSQIEKEYIATGKLRYVFRDFPLESIHPQAAKAAEAAHCAGDQSKYWEMHDRLFAYQQNLDPERLMEHAWALGLEAEPFKKCLNSGKYTERVHNDIAEGTKLRVSGTPTLLLGVSEGGKMKDVKLVRGSQPFALFKHEIDKLLTENEP
jgi:protein-disulfide isomerase